MSLDEMYMSKCREDQNLLDNHATFDEVKEMYKAGEIDLVTAMEMQVETPEYKNLKESQNEYMESIISSQREREHKEER